MADPLQPVETIPVSHWDCHIHGSLPLSRFGREDLARKRHRCKRCLADKMASYRARQPLRHMWTRFVQRAREHFSSDEVDGLDWSKHGQPLLSNIVDMAADTSALQSYKLDWMPGPVLHLHQVQLVKKRSTRTTRRAKAKVKATAQGPSERHELSTSEQISLQLDPRVANGQG